MKNTTNLAEIAFPNEDIINTVHSTNINLLETKVLDYLSEKRKRGYLLLKRFFDVFLSVLGLIVLSPLLLIVTAVIKLDSPGKAIYIQERVGKDGKKFKMYKFRSMCVDAEKKQDELQALNEVDGPVFKIAKDPRVTRVGKFIRHCSLDELRQLYNIITVAMSILGPRLQLPKEDDECTPNQKLRQRVAPGLTCYWQISGRSDMTFDKWIQLDLMYITSRNLWVDFCIVLKTIPAVLGHKGAY